MRKGSTQTTEARQKMTESHYRRYAIRGGQTPETRQKIAETQKKRYSALFAKITFAEAVMSGRTYR